MTNYKTQFMISTNPYMFRHWSVIFRESTSTKFTSPTLHFRC